MSYPGSIRSLKSRVDPASHLDLIMPITSSGFCKLKLSQSPESTHHRFHNHENKS